MAAMFTPETLLTMTSDKVRCVYSGKAGCGCGCKGKYSYHPAHIEPQTRFVNLKMVEKVLSIVKEGLKPEAKVKTTVMSNGWAEREFSPSRVYRLYVA